MVESSEILDPYTCTAKKTLKQANECKEVYLAKQGGVQLSESFRHFIGLEVLWLNGNRLARLENLEENFRVREVYIQDNRLVSLSGLHPKTFKFLTVLLASNNQLRNLEKQLQFLQKFSFLRKLDLFGNPVAEEPDYRLRLIYAAPQVETLDRHPIRETERARANEVVPNLDKVSAAAPKRLPKRASTLSVVERDCFRSARQIAEDRRRAEKEVMGQSLVTRSLAATSTFPRARWVDELAEKWSDPRSRALRELSQPSPWEKTEMRLRLLARIGASKGTPQTATTPGASGDEVWQWELKEKGLKEGALQVLALAGSKVELSGDAVASLAEELAKDGIEQVGRVLGTAAAQAARTLQSRASQGSQRDPELRLPPALGQLAEADARVPGAQVVDWLLSKEWPRTAEHELERHITRLRGEVRWAELAGDVAAWTQFVEEHKRAGASHEEAVKSNRNKLKALAAKQHEALRLEGFQASKQVGEAQLYATQQAPVLRKTRGDVFRQTFLSPARGLDEQAGRTTIKVAHTIRATSIGF
mmetsp:Transcript_61783/g.133889  ORF Transcript_61783/g.133889 Transcript_61783/m.133889 type:complete len:532 (-) Transcript_61783:68-1663(-)